jgi:hypothetical protein
MREMQGTKPLTRKVSVAADRSIAVDGLEFMHEMWSDLIPAITILTGRKSS